MVPHYITSSAQAHKFSCLSSVARGASDRGLSESDPNSAENVFFTNLLLLSFDPHKEEKKHGIPFHPKMFLTTNAKGMQVILYFLLNRLSSEKAKKVLPMVVTISSATSTYFRRLRTAGRYWIRGVRLPSLRNKSLRCYRSWRKTGDYLPTRFAYRTFKPAVGKGKPLFPPLYI